MTKYPRLLAYAQLLRLPNVFTAFADICLGACAAGYITDRPAVFALLLLTSGCLYLGGMVWNDYFDRHEDAKTQPFRPIPSGRVSAWRAAELGLMLIGWGLVAAVGADILTRNAGVNSLSAFGNISVSIAITIAAAVLLYDGYLKQTALGPLGMGACRFLNVLLGLSVGGGALWAPVNVHLAGVIGVYIVGVTWFARTEETDSNRRQLALAAVVMLLAAVGGLLVPVHRPEGATPVYFPYLLVAAGFWVGTPVVRAISRPEPKLVQAAVKRCIFGLVALDAVLATAFVGWPGLLILLLLLPAVYLGRWVYST
jgi:4-hydroxybenzoate polyprenyltransferase